LAKTPAKPLSERTSPDDMGAVGQAYLSILKTAWLQYAQWRKLPLY
jgi:hypothetical protein